MGENFKVSLCRDCKHCVPDPCSEWALCAHPYVVAADSGARPAGKAVPAKDERARWWRGSPCGARGALWEEK